ncbi:MAG: RIP metalloprotease RseP [Bacteroidales bacterium]|nr:RIP metalloprotease RseP [Bacteroidales bacterium]
MEGLIMTLQLILSLSILVTLHELGHFIAARAFGIRVEKFYLFFDAWGFKLFKFKKGETEYGIGWLPLGGYVKIAGMIDESMDKEQMKKPAQPWEFRSKPAWQRLIVMVGGVAMNIILGIAIFTMNIISFEKQYLPIDEVNKYGIYATETAQKIGFETGDKIIAVNGHSIERYNDANSIEVLFGSKITVERNGQESIINVPDTTYRAFKNGQRLYSIENFPTIIDSLLPGRNAEVAGFKIGDELIAVNNIPTKSFGKFYETIHNHTNQKVDITILRDQVQDTLTVAVDSLGMIGFAPKKPDFQPVSYTVAQAFKYGTSDAIGSMIVNIKGLGKVFNGQEKATEALQGPIAIATMFGPVWDWERFWRLTGLLSMILAFMNILPIPALDGGHVMFTLYEMITRRKPSDKFLEYAQIVGMVILLALMVFVFGNDIYRQFLS